MAKRTKKPGRKEMLAAKGLLSIPTMMGDLVQLILVQNKRLLQMEISLQFLVEKLTGTQVMNTTIDPKAPVERPVGVFFLNEAHTTHTTKAQARKERKEYLKKHPPTKKKSES